MKKKLSVLLKIAISVALLYFVFTKINVTEIINQLKQSSKYEWLFFAVLLFVISQIISSYRLNYIFHKNDFLLSQKSNLKLYFLGMFYNFFIPGGVGGDAYKVYLLNKKFDWKLKNVTSCILVDRLIGLTAIFFIISLLAGFLFPNKWFIPLGFLVSIFIFFIGKLVLQKLFKANPFYSTSFWYSVVIQLFQLGCIYAIMQFLNIENGNETAYFLVFLISSVLSIVSFAGFGAREYVFLQASAYLAFDESTSTTIGLLFNLITMAMSLIGILFLKPKLELQQD